MKSFMILLLIFSIILLIPISVQAEEHPVIFTDKESYDENDNVIIVIGENFASAVSITLLHPNGNYLLITGAQIDYGNFQQEISIAYIYESQNITQPLINGTFTILAMDQHNLSAETTFYVGSPTPEPEPEQTNPLTIQSDKNRYYIGDPIIINGTLSDVDWSADTSITYDIIYADEIVQTRSGITLQDDGTVNFLIDTNTWNDAGSHTITVTIQNFTADVSVHYENTPDMTNEALYEMGMTQYDMIDEQSLNIDDIETELVAQNETLESIQSAIDTILGILRGLLAGTDNN